MANKQAVLGSGARFSGKISNAKSMKISIAQWTTPWRDNTTQIRKFTSNVSIIANCIGLRKKSASRQRDGCGAGKFPAPHRVRLRV